MFHKIHIFQTPNSKEFLDKKLVFAPVCMAYLLHSVFLCCTHFSMHFCFLKRELIFQKIKLFHFFSQNTLCFFELTTKE